VDAGGLSTLYVLNKIGFVELQVLLYAEFLMFFTVTGLEVEGITPKLVVTPVPILVNSKAKISFDKH
jgi:hypothetical protein